MDEKQLFRDCLNGDRRAQKKLYDRYAGKMFAVCMRYAKDRPTAEDYLQEGFIRVFRKLDSFREEGSFEGWIRTIMVNTSLEILRKNDLLAASDDYTRYVGLAQPDPGIIEHMQEQELISLIQQMPAGFRTVFNLYAIEGYTHKEIGDKLQINEGTSKSQYARAKVWLQHKLIQSDERDRR
jgi:RNA polymerase sigma-70 factor (ECF subfamily)